MTRFDVVVTRRTKETHSITIDGAEGPRDSELITETVDSILCGWCGTGEAVDELGRTGAS